ncbi:MAG: LysM peptidoglycan-binding domain-containing protein [Planctomycetota bacterium]
MSPFKRLPSTSYFTFVVVILLGLFLYLGYAVQRRGEDALPFSPEETAPAPDASAPAPLAERPSSLLLEPVSPMPAERAEPGRPAAAPAAGLLPEVKPLPTLAEIAPLAPLQSVGASLPAPERAVPPESLAAAPVSPAPPAPLAAAATMPAATSKPEGEGPEFYTTRPGDTLTGVANRQCGASNLWREIARLNRDALPNPNNLKPGLRLRLPSRGAEGMPESLLAPSATSEATAGRRYTVVEGDGTLLNLAVRFYGTSEAVSVLRNANRETLARAATPGSIEPGMVLVIPPAPELRPRGPRTYTVKAGDTLSGIAKAMYNDSAQWKRIFEANAGKMADEHSLQVGARLVIPEP